MFVGFAVDRGCRNANFYLFAKDFGKLVTRSFGLQAAVQEKILALPLEKSIGLLHCQFIFPTLSVYSPP